MILVTGGLGFIGAHTTRALLDLGEPVTAVSRSATVPAMLRSVPGLTVERADITDPDALLALGDRHTFTAVIHLAAARLDGAPALDELRTNTSALFAVLRAAAIWDV